MYDLINVFSTKNVIDSSVPVTDGYTTAWRFVYRLDLPSILQPGDLLEVYAEHEFSNPGYPNTEIVTAIGCANNGQWYDTDLVDLSQHSIPSNGFWLAPPAGGNVDSIEHHRLVTRAGVATVPADASFNAYTSVIFKVRARRDVPSGYVVVEPNGYGMMYLKQWRVS